MWSHPHKGLEGRELGGMGGVLDYSKIMTRGVRELSELLSDFVPFFRPHVGDNYGLLMFVRKEYKVIEEGDIFVYKEKGYISEKHLGNHARNIQYVEIENATGPIAVLNFHGLWNGKGKTDTEDRIQQSENILEFTRKLKGEYILCGDFNLLPDTESVRLFENANLRNLIKEYKIHSTRTSFYTKPKSSLTIYS